ncbi:hypothetical protein RRF57_008569 [Xylaria bambusicola]|uniref:Uncharacterized protein n=1 Tax=Xylaria bambusicola TaxID=326684 RepID=A0AAN7Z0T8_9PEZI
MAMVTEDQTKIFHFRTEPGEQGLRKVLTLGPNKRNAQDSARHERILARIVRKGNGALGHAV